MTTTQVAAILALERRLEASKSRNYGHVVSGIASDAIALAKQQQAEIGRLRDALETLAAQTSGVPGSTNRADCMAALARAALTQQTQGEGHES